MAEILGTGDDTAGSVLTDDAQEKFEEAMDGFRKELKDTEVRAMKEATDNERVSHVQSTTAGWLANSITEVPEAHPE